MKIINVLSAFPGDGKSMLIRLISEDIASSGKKILIIDNSPTISGFKRMYNLGELAGVDAIRPLLKSEVLSISQLNEVIVTIDSNLDIDYLINSEIDILDDTELQYLIDLAQKEYEYIFIENNKSFTIKGFDVDNIFITRPSEYILKNKTQYKDCSILVVNKSDPSFNFNATKLGAEVVDYDSGIVMLENGYQVQVNAATRTAIRNLSNTVIGYELVDLLFEEKKEGFKLFKRGR